MNTKRPVILVTNDDGVTAPGIHRLVEALPDDADIYVVAPDGPRSAQSSALTMTNPLRIHRHPEMEPAGRSEHWMSVNGTPVDCVKLAMHAILPRIPDICLAGINHGSNAGNSIIYSGTMGAVIEACTLGIPSVGYSLLDHSMDADFSKTLPLIKDITDKVLAHGLPGNICLNVNFPSNTEILGVKTVSAAQSHWTDEYREYTDPNGHKFYLITGDLINDNPDDDGTDLYWLPRGYATAVPVTPDQSRPDMIPCVRDILGQ